MNTNYFETGEDAILVDSTYPAHAELVHINVCSAAPYNNESYIFLDISHFLGTDTLFTSYREFEEGSFMFKSYITNKTYHLFKTDYDLNKIKEQFNIK